MFRGGENQSEVSNLLPFHSTIPFNGVERFIKVRGLRKIVS